MRSTGLGESRGWVGVNGVLRVSDRSRLLEEVLANKIWEVQLADMLPKATEALGVFRSWGDTVRFCSRHLQESDLTRCLSEEDLVVNCISVHFSGLIVIVIGRNWTWNTSLPRWKAEETPCGEVRSSSG